MFAVSEILSKIGIGFVSNFLFNARVLFYCRLNARFFGFKKEIMLKNGEAICSHYQHALSGF